MTKGILGKRALDLLNRASEVRSEIDFCDEGGGLQKEGGGLQKEMYHFVEWMGDQLRYELQREAWAEPMLGMDEDGVSLYLYSATWRLPDEEQVAFSFAWPNCSSTRRASNSTFRPRTCSSREINYSTGFGQGERDDPDPSCPIWKYIRLEEFHGESGLTWIHLPPRFIDGFRGLMEVEPLIEDAFRSVPEKQLPAPKERRLRTIAFLDTECDGAGIERRLTELAIVNVAYDVDGDEVVGLLDEYCMGRGEKLDEPKARSVLERAEFTVAHNRFSPTGRSWPGISPEPRDALALLFSGSSVEAGARSPEREP